MSENSGDLSLGYMMGRDDSGSGSGSNNGGFGDFGGIWGILALVLILGGIGGFGGFGGFGGGSGLQGMATRADINEGFALNNITSGITGIERGIADSTYALNNSISGGFNSLSSQLAQCCCDNRAAVADLKYNISSEFCALGNAMQSGFRDVIESNNAGTRAILDFLTQDKIATLTAENQSLKFAASQANQNAFITASQDAQTAEIIRRVAPMPVPSYTVPAPYPYGYNAGYGCGCGCGC